ncbi:two-component system, chemotaxis family, response regulator WspR [Candidatus Magnetomoraceae bacterium gMMP-13]
MSILIVDDSIQQRKLLQHFLLKGGFEVIHAGSAKEAFEILGLNRSNSTTQVDVILMDVMMPEVDGIEACSYIKNCEHTKNIPILMVTATSEIKNMERAFSAGAMDFITKPVKKMALIARVKSFIKLKQEMDIRKARESELIELTKRLKVTNQMLQRISLTDGLTDISNRRSFDDYLEHEWKVAVRHNKHISLIIADIDYFKFFNDTYGHQRGDVCLKKVAKTLVNTLKRPRDFIARYGGEEFAAVLPETDLKGARLLAVNMLSNVIKLGIVHTGSCICNYVTISAGVTCTVPKRDSKPSILIQKADKLLYKAKKKRTKSG